MNSSLLTQREVDEVIRIIKSVKKHLTELPACNHSLEAIVTEALCNECAVVTSDSRTEPVPERMIPGVGRKSAVY
jgi:hypothetical protein